MDMNEMKQRARKLASNKGVLATAGVAALIGAGGVGYAIGDEGHEGHHDDADRYGMHDFEHEGMPGFPPPPPPPPGVQGDERMRPGTEPPHGAPAPQGMPRGEWEPHEEDGDRPD